jgi:hypothetical protein
MKNKLNDLVTRKTQTLRRRDRFAIFFTIWLILYLLITCLLIAQEIKPIKSPTPKFVIPLENHVSSGVLIPMSMSEYPFRHSPKVDKLNEASKEDLTKSNLVHLMSRISKGKTPESTLSQIYDWIDEITTEYADKYGYKKDVPKILAILTTESRTYNTKAISTASAKGLMQITPIALKSVCQDWKTNPKNYNLYDPESNLRVGIYYFLRNESKWGTETALVSYNQGYKNIKQAVIRSRGSETSYLTTVIKFRTLFNKGVVH